MCRRSLSLLVVFSLAASSVFAGLNFSGDRSTVRVSGGTFNVKSALSGASNNSGIIDVQSGATLALTNNITNWSGTVKSDGTVSGGDKGKYIGFSNGIYETGGVKSLLTTSVYPTVDTNSTFSLVNGDKVEAAPGTIADTIYVGPASGSGIVEATIEGQSGYSGNITVSSGATLIMNLQGALNSNITFSTLESVASTQTLDNAFTGSIKLLNDLKLADGVVLAEATGCTALNQGCGVDLNGYSFVWGARGASGAALKITDSTTWENAGDVVLTGSMALETTWVFNDVNSVLQGNGNVLDMSHASACIEVPKGKSLHISDVVLKGYSGEKILLKGAYDTANTSTVYFSNVSVHLTGAAATSNGTIYVDGPTTVYPQGNLWTIAATNARMKIDGVTVWLDEGSSSDSTFGFAFNDWDASDYANSGTIKEVAVDVEDIIAANEASISGLTSNFAVIKACGCRFESAPTFTFNYFVGAGNTMYFDKSSDSFTVNGGGFYIDLERGASDVINFSTVSKYTTTFEDLRIKNFKPQAFNTSNDSADNMDMCFGNNSVLELSEDISLDQNLFFKGASVEIHGFGHEINLNAKDLAVVPNTNLKIYNARIYGLKDTDVFDIDTSSTLELHNCEIVQTGNAYNLSAGTINMYGNNEIKGDGSARTFQVTAAGTVTIQSGSTLKLNRDMTFDYDVANSAGLSIESNGKLHLNGCTFDAAGASGGLTVGGSANTTLIIEDRVSINGGPSAGNTLKFHPTNLTTVVRNGGVIDIRDGFVDFDS